MVNLLSNPSFEWGWTDDGNRQIPDEFDFWYAPESERNPYSDVSHNRFLPPELRVLHKNAIPPEEHSQYIWSGDQTIKCFGAAWKGGLAQWVELPDGHYRLTVNVWCDAHIGYDADGHKIPAPDPTSGLMRFCAWRPEWKAQGGFSAWFPMTPFLTRQTHSWDFYADGIYLVGAEWMYPYAISSTAIFTDAWELVAVDGPCRGAPREQFESVYHVLPPNATWDQAKQIFKRAGFGRHRTVGYSHDHAGIGDLDDRTAVLWGIPSASHQEYEDWYTTYYPGVDVKFLDLPGGGGNGPAPTSPNVGGWLGIHQLQSQPDGMAEMMAAKPRIFKAVDRIDQIIAAYRMTPEDADTEYAFRRFHVDEGGTSFRYNPNKPEAAQGWVQYSVGDLAPELKAAGVPTNKVYILSLNEVWEYDQALNRHSIEFDLEFVKALAAFNAANGTEFRPIASSMAVGNPALPSENESQWQEILPLARAIRDAGGAMNYHGYGLCDPQRPEYLADYAPYLQDRWLKYFDWLKAHGVVVPWFLGEGGHVGGSVTLVRFELATNLVRRMALAKDFYTVMAGSEIITLEKRKTLYPNNDYGARMWLNPGQGWNGLIPVDRAVDELLRYFNAPIKEKNKAENWQACIGGTPFQGGNSGDWGRFDLQGEPYKRLAIAFSGQ